MYLNHTKMYNLGVVFSEIFFYITFNGCRRWCLWHRFIQNLLFFLKRFYEQEGEGEGEAESPLSKQPNMRLHPKILGSWPSQRQTELFRCPSNYFLLQRACKVANSVAHVDAAHTLQQLENLYKRWISCITTIFEILQQLFVIFRTKSYKVLYDRMPCLSTAASTLSGSLFQLYRPLFLSLECKFHDLIMLFTVANVHLASVAAL